MPSTGPAATLHPSPRTSTFSFHQTEALSNRSRGGEGRGGKGRKGERREGDGREGEERGGEGRGGECEREHHLSYHLTTSIAVALAATQHLTSLMSHCGSLKRQKLEIAHTAFLAIFNFGLLSRHLHKQQLSGSSGGGRTLS